MKRIFIGLAVLLTVVAQRSFAQHYFIDGYHGGRYGHYPEGYTAFMTSQLQAHPYWNINLELEPETWDMVRITEPEAYAAFKKMFADQSDAGRIEYVNPGYGQSYLYTSSGESMIRQFSYGIQKVKEHFPGAVFSTYSSEEPCFTSALPQVLLSFGFKYASLKNPNTCWGGYIRAFGGELVQWEGPDGSRLPTVPRYSTEKLVSNSTWQTTAWNNGEAYIQSALAAGIRRPVGMCLQDAGWRVGPWLKENAQYATWRHYIGHIADRQQATLWKLSQEDIQVSLVWGAQVLQRIAQQVRMAENKLAAAEKYAAIRVLHDHQTWPQQSLDTAWKSLLLAQHHDCWIVPYNGHKGDQWIDKVKRWTDMTLAVSDSILQQHETAAQYVRIVNTTAQPREEWLTITNTDGSPLLINAKVPSMGYKVYELQAAAAPVIPAGQHQRLTDGRYAIETDQYRVVIDPYRGGVITSLQDKKRGRRELVDRRNARGFNELRGYFYREGAWRSSMDTMADVRIITDNQAQVTAEIKGFIAGHPFTQRLTLVNGRRRIDMQLKIDWQGDPGIGAPQAAYYRAEDYHKAFYNDSFKLQVLFPLQLSQQQLSKDAPYDVTESRLPNTFFSSWDSIKNNVILHWAAVTDGHTGMAMFTDHTTSYVHGQQYPLGLTVQYAGTALWGRNYHIDGPTEVKYAILPHRGKWDAAGVSREAANWCEPLQLMPAAAERDFSLLSLQDENWEIPALLMDGKDLLIRIYNAAGDSRAHNVYFSGTAAEAVLEQLNGQALQTLPLKTAAGKSVIRLAIPRFGIRTIRLKNVNVQH
ncbi:glycoside hydrolase family 38 C-terminal domain-containing protein [uncultured Chitinophaga sp.]|jgi:Alpha-mannosidase|uniref:glycoside hydrolase family 38 C-terminal domain-containing protein n=1 Tax=uncultured Chitinophaga sp. TaxID=339340 RepID=UPI002607F066|nr:glycoside hydrolase family 38 C-terminal domain-containing protein [uncultured Chitinophaga sp.]